MIGKIMNNCNKPPVNMRRALRMMDGGEIHADMGGMWESLKRTATGRPAETLSEQYARKDAARAASRPAPAPVAAPAAAPPAQTAAPMGSQSVLDRRMAAAGLRDGGDLRTGHGGVVPGTGTGDKIPAKYEPGEFVVSNDMLNAQPELRGHLRSLRESVLAEKGMTPEQADAKALDGTGLRAMDGRTPLLPYDKSVGARAAEATTQAEYAAKQVADAKLRAEALTQQARVAPPNSGPPNAPRGYRAGQSAMKGVKLLGKAAPIVGAAIETGDVVDVARDPNSSKIDVATQAAEGVSKLAGATAGGLAGAAVGGPLAPLTGLAGGIAGYYAPEVATKALRWANGVDTTSPIDRVRAAPAPTPSHTQTTPPKLRQNDPVLSGTGVSAPPSPAPSLRTQSFAAGTPEAIAASKKMDSGSAYIPGNGQGMMRNSKGDIVQFNTGAVPPPQLVQQPQLRQAGPSYTDMARNAPSLTGKPQGPNPRNMSFLDEVRYNTMRKQSDRSRSLDIQENSNIAGNRVTLRGQDLSAQTAQRGQDLEAQTRQGQSEAAQRAQLNDDRKYELDVARLGLESANKLRDDKRAGEEAFSKRITSMIGDDKDGVVAARVRNGANVFLADSIRAAEAELRQNPGNAKATRDLRRLQDGGVGALDDKMISDLVLGQQGNAAAAEYAGMAPWSGKAVDTAAPIKSLKLKKGLLFDDYVSDSASGNQVIPARALEKRPDLKRLRIE